MRWTNIDKGFVRRFVYGWQVGRRQAKRVMRNGQQIWPGSDERIRRIALDMSGLEVGVTRAYWEHALAAVAASSSSKCYLGFRIAGRQYRVNTTYNGIARARYSLGTLNFGDNGPVLDDVRVGDVISFTANICARNSLEYEGQEVCPLPYLSGTLLRVCFGKGQKRRWAGRRFTVTGREGGIVHYGGSCETSEHKRGLKTRVLPGNTHKWYNRVYNDEMIAEERELLIDTAPMGSAGGRGVTLMWPAFNVTFKLRVTAIEIA